MHFGNFTDIKRISQKQKPHLSVLEMGFWLRHNALRYEYLAVKGLLLSSPLPRPR
jgi:hypothetical protein